MNALRLTSLLFLIGLAAFVTVPADAQTTANGSYYATPSWDQTLPSSTRFIVLSNMNSEAVLDRETGLVWQRTPAVPPAGEWWQLSSARCASARTGGRLGWRLPTMQELSSLIDPTATSGPPLFPGHPFVGVQPVAAYWTATSADADSAYLVHWGIHPGEAHFTFTNNTLRPKSTTDESFYNTPMYSWCVRGGLQSADQ
jgi:Protein of unknown function (DUF1566)